MPRSLLPALLALALLGGADRARAVEVELVGPAGAEIFVDGEPMGVLPLAAPLDLQRGDHELEARLRGAETFRRPLTVGHRGGLHTVQVRMAPLRRSTAALSSLLIAGQGQRYVDRPALGWALTAAEAVGLVAALAGETELRNKKDDYAIARADYAAAVTPGDIDAARAEMEQLTADMGDAADLRDLGLTLAVGAVAVSVLDALLRFPGLDADVNLDAVGPFDGSGTGAGFRLGLNLQF